MGSCSRYFYSGGISNGERSSPDSWNKTLAKCGKPSPNLEAKLSIDCVAGLLAPGLQVSQFKFSYHFQGSIQGQTGLKTSGFPHSWANWPILCPLLLVLSVVLLT